MPTGHYSQPTLVSLSSIHVSQRKLNRLSRTKLERYRNDLENGCDFPPIKLVDCGDFYTIFDGRHRFAASCQAGFETIPACIRS